MKVSYHPSSQHGVTTLMYVSGGDQLDQALGEDWASKGPKLAIAVGLLAFVLHVALKPPRRR